MKTMLMLGTDIGIFLGEICWGRDPLPADRQIIGFYKTRRNTDLAVIRAITNSDDYYIGRNGKIMKWLGDCKHNNT